MRAFYNFAKDNETETDVIEKELWWQKRSLMYTASGYGRKIPTRYMVRHNGRFKRVYCAIFGNCGTLYIISRGEKIDVDIQK